MALQTLNQLSTLPFENNLVLNMLTKEDKSSFVYDLSEGYNTLDFIVSRVSEARKTAGKDGKFSKPIMGVSVVQAEIASTYTNGNLLRINFVDGSYDKFRVTEVVSDGTALNTQGRVVNKGAGFIELEVSAGTTTWNTAIHFLAGKYATVYYNSQPNRGSGGLASLYEYPTYVDNWTAIMRDNVELYRRDMEETWVEFQGK